MIYLQLLDHKGQPIPGMRTEDISVAEWAMRETEDSIYVFNRYTIEVPGPAPELGIVHADGLQPMDENGPSGDAFPMSMSRMLTAFDHLTFRPKMVSFEIYKGNRRGEMIIDPAFLMP